MIKEHEGIEMTGLDEWSSYFNYAQAKYPDLIRSKPYIVMCWPGLRTDWKMFVKPTEYLFENHYDFLYKDNRIFDGLSEEYSENTDAENLLKIERVTKSVDEYFEWKNKVEKYINKVKKDRLEIPSFIIYCDGDEVVLGTPEALELPVGATIHLPVSFKGKKDGLKMQLCIISDKGTVVSMPEIKLELNDIKIVDNKFDAALVCGTQSTKKGSYALVMRIDDGKNTIERQTAIKLV
jgi:hypothetical protein